MQTKSAAADTPLPEPNDYVIRAIADWLHGREQSQRVPIKTATVLALICQLYQKQRPFPTRPAIMKHLGLTESLIDMAISQRAAEGLIFVNVKTEQGRVRKRLSSVQRRYIEPSPELLRVFDAAVKRDRTERRRMQRGSITTTAGIVTALATVTAIGCGCCLKLIGMPCQWDSWF